MEFAVASLPFKENHNPDEGSSLCVGLDKTPEKKPRRKKHRPKVIREGKPKRTPKPVTPKHAQSKENTTEAAKMSCQRSLNFELRTKDEISAGRENTTSLLGKATGVAVQETNFSLACDLNTSVKHASNSSKSLPEDTAAPDTSSQSTNPGAKPKETPTGKRKYVRRKLNKTAPPTEVTGELTTENMSELANPPCKSSVNSDQGRMEESSVVKEDATTHLSEDNVFMEGTNPDLAYDVKTSMKQASDTQATNTASRRKSHEAKTKESPCAERHYVRRSGSHKSSTPAEVSGDLPGKVMPESAKTSSRRPLNFDRVNEETSTDRGNATVHLCKETGAAMQETDIGLVCDMETFMKQAEDAQASSTYTSKGHPPPIISCRMSIKFDKGREESNMCNESLVGDQNTLVYEILHDYTSLSENTQAPSTCLPKSNLPCLI